MLKIENLRVRAGAFSLGPVDVRLDAGRTLVVLGPSGAGKSVFLDTLAGFRKPESGSVRLGGEEITHWKAEARQVGFVFQDYALFPHLSVLENVRFGLRARGLKDSGGVDALMTSLGIASLADRRPLSLSGGERQRVALARALAIEPRLLLLDEPLSALDAPTREELRILLRKLLRAVECPSIYVTHDRAEAMSLANDLVVMISGRVHQLGPAMDVFDSPADADVARLLGFEILGRGKPVGAGCVEVGAGRLEVSEVPAGARVVDVCYRPEDVELMNEKSSAGENSFEGTVTQVLILGSFVRIDLEGPLPLKAVITRRLFGDLGIAEGSRVAMRLPARYTRAVAVQTCKESP